MPAYNCESTLIEAVESVQRQSLQDWELLIVDDASEDSTLALARGLAAADKRIIVSSRPHNSGGAVAPRNEAVAAASGDYIAFLDADDKWCEDKLESQLFYMQRAGLDLSGTWVTVCDDQGAVTGRRCPEELVTFESMLKNNALACSSVMCKSYWLKKHPFPSVGHEDYALWLILLQEQVRAGILQRSLTFYRKHKRSLSANKFKVVPYFWHIYRRLLKFSWFQSAVFTCRYMALAALRDLKR
ncbi:glycosyltransferase family 2 protein [Gilvimarinus sp. DA14]|uniref:glycosyltransferase family 2 protein n=1 Tax=Gilvimarinus sp. DA14 TaxID=2956798 RepID=UPI0020B73A68|nr:glycosyltransferase family 2 protein [Gilvimarinus sp. DA14]UTF59841.1 glycosyltransferase [Gilvimarinus sp. DA14]